MTLYYVIFLSLTIFQTIKMNQSVLVLYVVIYLLQDWGVLNFVRHYIRQKNELKILNRDLDDTKDGNCSVF